MNTTLKLAGLPIGIETVYDCLTASYRDYTTDEAPCFTVRTTADDILHERQKTVQEYAYEGQPCPSFSPEALENTAVYRKIAQQLPAYDGLVFHGSAVAVRGEAYLFTAKSGTGKTTHTNLWLKNIPGSYVVNGDKPILRFMDGQVFVCGTPWMGKENLGRNECVPLAAICILERGEENTIRPVSFIEAMPTLIAQSYRPPDREALSASLKVIETIGRWVNFYRLSCNMEDDAAQVAYRGMCR